MSESLAARTLTKQAAESASARLCRSQLIEVLERKLRHILDSF
jgi:hypothetical protein